MSKSRIHVSFAAMLAVICSAVGGGVVISSCLPHTQTPADWQSQAFCVAAHLPELLDPSSALDEVILVAQAAKDCGVEQDFIRKSVAAQQQGQKTFAAKKAARVQPSASASGSR